MSSIQQEAGPKREGLIQRFERAAAEYAEACERSRRAEIPVVLTLMQYFARGSDDYESYRDRYNVLRGIHVGYRPYHRGVYLL
ncbi:MAG: hypothetical protein OXK17_08440 [Thaumarchaeota archaeon]|nr:hypothetical protein [Nitrososphaerota archaeon]